MNENTDQCKTGHFFNGLERKRTWSASSRNLVSQPSFLNMFVLRIPYGALKYIRWTADNCRPDHQQREKINGE